ncbi:MAG: hypothetical protein ACI4XL_02455 [Bacillus sp. (in: firmicutes)]
MSNTAEKPDHSEDISGFGVQAALNDVLWKAGKGATYAFHDGIAKQLSHNGNTVTFVEDNKGIAVCAC